MRGAGLGCNIFYPRVPKTIVLENWRLGVLLKLLQALLVILLIYLMVIQEAWLKEIPQADFQGGLTFWATPSSNEEYTKSFARDLEQDWCANAKDYNYKYDEYLKYADYSCIGMPPHERWIRGETELYLPVSFHEQYMLQANFHSQMVTQHGDCQDALKDNTPCAKGWKTMPRGMGLLGCECELTGGNYFVAGAEELALGMELFYKVKADKNVRSEGSSTKEKSTENGEEKTGLLVVIQDHNGETVSKHEPGGGQPIMISMSEILKHSGAKLDESMENTLANSDPTGKLKYPLLRMTGVTISAQITYMNTASDHQTDWDGPVAVVSLSHQKIWSRKAQMEHDKPLAQFMQENKNSFQMGQYRYRQYSGVSIKFSTSSIWKQPSFVNFVGFVGQSIPYLYLPVILVTLIALNCLGPLAKIYKRAGQQKVGLKGHKGNAAVRMVIAAKAYQQLKGYDDYLSKSTLKKEMLKIMQETGLYEENGEGKVTEVEKQMVDRMCEELDANEDDHITLQEFMQAAIGHDLVGPRELADCEHQSMTLKSMGVFSRLLYSEGSHKSLTKLHQRSQSRIQEQEVVPKTV